MSSAQEYRYVIEVNPEDLNKIEQYVNRLQEGGAPTEGVSGVVSKEDMDKILTAIQSVSGGYSSTTYTYDDDKINKILQLTKDTKNLTVRLLAQLAGITLPEELGDLVDQVEDLSQLDLFKITEDLAKMDNLIRGEAFEGRLNLADIMDRQPTETLVGLSREAMREIANMTAQVEIREPLSQEVLTSPDLIGNIFPASAVERFTRSIDHIVDLQRRIERKETEKAGFETLTEKWMEKARKEGDEELVAFENLKTLGSAMNTTTQEIQALKKELDDFMGGGALAQQFRRMREQGIEGLTDIFRNIGLTNEQIAPIVDQFEEFVKSFRYTPEVFKDDLAPQQRMLMEFIRGILGEETTLPGLDDIKINLVDTIMPKFEEALKGFHEALRSGKPSDIAGATNLFQFTTQARAVAGIGITPIMARAFGQDLGEVRSMITKLDIAVKAAMGQVNTEVQAGMESQAEGEEKADTGIRDLLTQIDGIKTALSEKIDELAGNIEEKDKKDDASRVRTT